MNLRAATPAPQIVVLGAGFAGLTFCQTFRHPTARLTLVDRENHHLFQPLLYQVATAGLSAPEIAQPIRSILRSHRNVSVRLREVVAVDLSRREVGLDGDVLRYDYLVLALGGRTHYFGHPEWAHFAPGLKTLDDALTIRRQVLLAFERAEEATTPTARERLMTFVVIGGGPTGVELAGALAELTRRALRRDFRRINPQETRVILVEAGPRLLNQFSVRLSAKAAAQLTALGVHVHLGTPVQRIAEGVVRLADGTTLSSANILWTAGVAANPLTQTLGVSLDRAGRVRVNPDLSVPGHPEVFAVGDLALALDGRQQPVPGVAPAAIQMARHVARLIQAELRHPPTAPKARSPFRYRDKGMMATIGRSAGAVQLGRWEFSGWLAWMAWLLTHLLFLIGFRNRAAVLLQWTYSYFTYKRGARIVSRAAALSPLEPGAQPPSPAPGDQPVARTTVVSL